MHYTTDASLSTIHLVRAASNRAESTWVDAVMGRHISGDVDSLLRQRALTFRKDYGWCYDVWPESSTSYALAGANGRCAWQDT